MRVGFIGLGKLGFPVALAIESCGHEVKGFDVNPAVAGYVRSGRIPYTEEGVDKLLASTTLEVLTSPQAVAEWADVIFVAVQTPHAPRYEGVTELPDERVDFDYSHLVGACADLFAAIDRPTVVAIISTVLPGTIDRLIRPMLTEHVKLCYTPQFIAMGTTVRDFLHPEFTLLGVDDPDAADTMERLFHAMTARPVFRTDVATAEGIKVLYNTYITAKTVLGNLYGELAERCGMNADDIYAALSLADRRLMSPAYLRAGVGDGGGCFPAGELVMTRDGMRPIESIEPGMEVLTHTGSYRRVVHHWRRHYCGDIITVKVAGQPSVRMTADHPVLARLDGRTVMKDGRRTTRISTVEMLKPVEEVAAGEVTTSHLIGWPHVTPGDDVRDEQAYRMLAGWYLSEGSCELSPRRGRLRFDLHEREGADALDIERWLCECAPERQGGRGANARITHKVEGNRRSVRFGSKGLVERLVADFGKGAAGKRIPSRYLHGVEGVDLLWGLIRGDGHRSPDNGISYATISRDLAWGVWYILHREGVAASLRIIPERPGHQQSYEVRVRNRHDANRLCALVGWPQYEDAREWRVHPTDESGVWRHVRSVEVDRGWSGEVHNLWVEGDNTYVTALGAVHNCHPRDNIALSWLAREVGLSFDLFESLMVARQEHMRWIANVVIDAAEDARLPVVVFGQSFKAGTNITTGSAAVLLVQLLTKAGHTPWRIYDPHAGVRDFLGDPHPRAVYVIATDHGDWPPVPTGSVVIDPFGSYPDVPGVEVRRLGRR